MKGAKDVLGLRDIRSQGKSGWRSIPRVQRSPYLELHMLQKEEERLRKEAALIDKRARGIQKRAEDIRTRMESLEEWARSERPGNGANTAAAPARRGTRKWKTFSLNY